jgi:excisionase family DNA binding protein
MTPLDEPTPPGQYLTSEAIAAELGVHVQTVQRYFREDGLPGRKIGKSWTTTRAALDAWLTGAAPAGDTHIHHNAVPLETKS